FTLGIVVMILLIFTPIAKQIQILIYAAVSGIVSLLFFDHIFELRQQLRMQYIKTFSLNGPLLVVFVSLLTGVMIYLINRYLGEWLNKKLAITRVFSFKNVLIPSLLVGLGVVALLLISSSAIQDLLPN